MQWSKLLVYWFCEIAIFWPNENGMKLLEPHAKRCVDHQTHHPNNEIRWWEYYAVGLPVSGCKRLEIGAELHLPAGLHPCGRMITSPKSGFPKHWFEWVRGYKQIYKVLFAKKKGVKFNGCFILLFKLCFMAEKWGKKMPSLSLHLRVQTFLICAESKSETLPASRKLMPIHTKTQQDQLRQTARQTRQGHCRQK